MKAIDNSLKSEIEIYRHLIEVGDKICYCDGLNGMLYEVTELFDGGVKLKH